MKSSLQIIFNSALAMDVTGLTLRVACRASGGGTAKARQYYETVFSESQIALRQNRAKGGKNSCRMRSFHFQIEPSQKRAFDSDSAAQLPRWAHQIRILRDIHRRQSEVLIVRDTYLRDRYKVLNHHGV